MSSCNLQLAEGHEPPGRPGRTGGSSEGEIHQETRTRRRTGFKEEIKDKVDGIKENQTDQQDAQRKLAGSQISVDICVFRE